MKSSRVNKVGHTQLLDVAKALKPWMGNDVVKQFTRNGYKSIDRIINGLFFVQAEDDFKVGAAAVLALQNAKRILLPAAKLQTNG